MMRFTIEITGAAMAQELAADVEELGYFLRRLSEENASALGEEVADAITDEDAANLAAWLWNFADAIEASKEREDL